MGTIGRYISVIASWMLTLTSFLEVLCKIVALPDPIAKTLFGIFLMVSLLLSVHFFVYLMKMDAPNVKIPNKVNDYLNCIEKVERRNKSLHVISEKFDVNLIKAGNDVANLEMSRNVQSGNTQNLKSMVIQRSFPKWSVAERRKTAAASDQAAVCACAHSRYFAGGSPSGLRV